MILAPVLAALTLGIASTEPQLAPDHGAAFFAQLHHLGLTGVRMVVYRNNPATEAEVQQSAALALGLDVSVVLVDSPDANLAGFDKWAASVAEALPTVDRFVVWNEPNNPAFWKYSAVQYAQLLTATYVAIEAVRPDASVSGFGLAPYTPGTGSNVIPPDLFLSAARQYGPFSMDELSVHLYPQGTLMETVRQLRAIERLTDCPINVDEFGVAAAGTDYDVQADDYHDMIEYAQNDPRVRSLLFYRLQDAPGEPNTGLITADGARKHSYYAVER